MLSDRIRQRSCRCEAAESSTSCVSLSLVVLDWTDGHRSLLVRATAISPSLTRPRDRLMASGVERRLTSQWRAQRHVHSNALFAAAVQSCLRAKHTMSDRWERCVQVQIGDRQPPLPNIYRYRLRTTRGLTTSLQRCLRGQRSHVCIVSGAPIILVIILRFRRRGNDFPPAIVRSHAPRHLRSSKQGFVTLAGAVSHVPMGRVSQAN